MCRNSGVLRFITSCWFCTCNRNTERVHLAKSANRVVNGRENGNRARERSDGIERALETVRHLIGRKEAVKRAAAAPAHLVLRAELRAIGALHHLNAGEQARRAGSVALALTLIARAWHSERLNASASKRVTNQGRCRRSSCC